MSQPRTRQPLPTVVTLILGLGLGWLMANHRPSVVKATGGDRYGDYSLTTGPIAMQYNEVNKTQAPQDAVYFLDYKGARLVATVPNHRQSAQGTQMIGSFIERDLIADFKVDPGGSSPHFLMTVGSLGALTGEGWAPLFVFETTTKQVAVYRLQLQNFGNKAASRFELIEIKSYAALPVLPTGS